MNFRDFKEKVKKYPLFSSDILEMLSPSPQVLRNQINRWRKKGLILTLKRGLYTLAPEERSAGLSTVFLANNLYAPSYISLESALSHYKLIPERVAGVTSITTRKTKSFSNELGTFIYKKLKTNLFFGFRQEKDEFGFNFLIAEPEKALLDYLYLNLGAIEPVSTDYFTASLRLQNRSSLNRKKLLSYCKKYGVKKMERLAACL